MARAVPTLADVAPSDSSGASTPTNSAASGIVIGVHAGGDDPCADAAAVGAQALQVFLGNPQSWSAPTFPYGSADEFASTAHNQGLDIWVHAPYLINVATGNNKVRIPSRKALGAHIEAAAAVGAKGLVVHGGQVQAGEDHSIGYANWTKAVDQLDMHAAVQVMIENTAGGENSMARGLDAIARLWDAVGHSGVGFCFDTCHAWASGIELPDAIDAVLAITGRIDLVHCNDSRDEFGSHRDRHANLGSGFIPVDALVEAVRRANAPLILETSAEGQQADITLLREHLNV